MRNLGVIALAVSLAACSAKVTSGTDQPAPSDTAVMAQAIQGKWTTGCYKENGAYVAENLEFASDKLKAVAVVFSDSACSHQVIKQQKEGSYTVSGKFAAVYSIDMNVTENGTPSSLYGAFLIENDTLYFGDYNGANPQSRPSDVNRSKPYKKGEFALNAAPPPPVPPTTCVDLSGKYQMNSDLFQLTQKGCASLEIRDLGFGTVENRVYQTDGFEREISASTAPIRQFEKSFFTADAFKVELRLVDSVGTRVDYSSFRLTYKPCNLMNPSGDKYLELVTTYSSNRKPATCNFWAKNN